MRRPLSFSALVAARTSLIGFVTAWFLSSSVGRMALHEGDWVARGIMLSLLAGVWCSVFALSAAHTHFSATAQPEEWKS